MRPLVLLTALAATAAAADFKLGNHTFTLPDGFEIEAVAASPLVDRPINMSFDETGALYVTDSSGSNEKPDVQVKNPTHRVLRLVDKDGDGKFDDKTVFADKLSFPEGAMWLDGSLYVSAPPQIWKFTDGDADGIAEKREIWFDGKTLTGCANDLHGPYAGPDGFIYWCKGAFAEQRHALANGKQLVTKASHVFRARPDGSGLENVMTGGMDNPVDVVFTPGGERLVSGTFFIHPGGGKRDGILHAVWGGVYGKDHAVLDGHPRTGELMPIMTHMGPAAASGMELTRSGSWGADWLGNVYCCNFNLRKVTRHVLAPDGASFKTTDSDFVVSDHTDFHPTDVVEDADGSLLIADTGGWYKLCCPTSTLAKADVLGAIYRVKKKDAQRVDDPRGLKLDWAKADATALATRLSDPRHEVVARAMAALAKIGESAISPVATLISTPRVSANTTPVQARLNAINTLTRIPGESARAAVRFAFADKSPLVRIAVAQSASLWRDAGATEALINHLTHADAQLRRISAEALGRIGDPRAVQQILANAPSADDAFDFPADVRPSWMPKTDRVLEHSLAFALFEIGKAESIEAGLAAVEKAADGNLPMTTQAQAAAVFGREAPRRVALLALDMLGAAKPKQVSDAFDAGNTLTQDRLVWMMSRHAEWGDALAMWLKDRFSRSVANPKPEGWPTTYGMIVRSAGHPAIQQMLADAASGKLNEKADPKDEAAFVETAFSIMGLCKLKSFPASWGEPLLKALAGENPPMKSSAVSALHGFTAAKNVPPALFDALPKIAADSKLPEATRVEALEILGSRIGAPDDPTFEFLVSRLKPTIDIAIRLKAADCISKAKLSGEQRMRVAVAIGEADGQIAGRLLTTFEPGGDEAVGKGLLGALRNSKTIASIRPDSIQRAFAKFPEAIRKEAESLSAAPPDTAQQRARLDELTASLKNGDVKRGHQIFRSTKATCTTCHAMAYVGGNLGPDLTKIGATRNERDLLEAIVFPSASFVRSYESVIVKTKDVRHPGIALQSTETKAGEQLGILKKDAADEIVLATGIGTESRIPRTAVVDIQPAPVSLMPPGFDGILTPGELADLVAFLRSQK